MLEAALAAGVAAGGGHALLGGVLPTPGRVAAGAPLRLRPGGRRLGVAQPLRGQRDQVLRPGGHQARRRPGGRDRAPARRARGRPPGPGAGAARRAGATTCASSRRASASCASTASRSCSTARTAPPTASRPRSSAASAPTWTPWRWSRTGATSTATAARRTSSGSPIVLDGHDLGFAFDGDGDRVLAIDRNGVVVDGDELLALAALHLREHDRLPGDGVAVTVMTNYGFHRAMREHGRGGGDHARSATATSWSSCCGAAGRSAASSPGTSSTPASCPPATAPPPRC